MGSDFSSLTLSEAKTILKQYSSVKDVSGSKQVLTIAQSFGNKESPYSLDRLRQALELVARHSEYQILGICAQSAEEGLKALREYCQALGYEPPRDLDAISGSIYIKFNPNIGLRYISAYEGTERGVLVSCQSPNSDGVNELYGHLPLDLFMSHL